MCNAGQLICACRQLEFDLAACPDADITYTSERLHVAGDCLGICLGKGAMELQALSLSATAHRVGSGDLSKHHATYDMVLLLLMRACTRFPHD